MARATAFYSVGAAATKDLPPNYNSYTFPGGGGDFRKITSFEHD